MNEREKISFDELDIFTYSYSRLLETYNGLTTIINEWKKIDPKAGYCFDLQELRSHIHSQIINKTHQMLDNINEKSIDISKKE